MKVVFICLTVFLLAIECESADQAVCKFCQDAIAKVQSISPQIDPSKSSQLTGMVRAYCDTEKMKQYQLTELCNEFVDAIVAPILKKAGDDGKYDPSDCNAIQLC